MGAGCIVHCNKISKPVKGKYLLLCMNSVMYFLLTSYTLIMFLSQFVMKIKNFMKYLKEGVLKYFKISMKFLNISKWNISSWCRPRRRRLSLAAHSCPLDSWQPDLFGSYGSSLGQSSVAGYTSASFIPRFSATFFTSGVLSSSSYHRTNF